VDVFPAAEKDMVRAMLSESLRAVVSQTLMKRVGGGRIAAHEIMIGTPAIRNLIREGKNRANVLGGFRPDRGRVCRLSTNACRNWCKRAW